MSDCSLLGVRYRVVKEEDGSEACLLSRDEFLSLVRKALLQIRFDEKWYLDRYQDVRKAVDARKFRSGGHHFVERGFYEGRLPYDIKVDENFYLKQYSDVATAIKSGKIKSAQSHFENNGFKEGRLAAEKFSPFAA